jgi:hypothetical protein
MALNTINKGVQAMLMTPRPADKTHREYLVKLLCQYINMLKESYVDLKQYEYKRISYAEILTCVKDICSKLLKVYDLYMQGDVAKSIQVMRDCFTRTDLRLIEQITSSDIMYRARVIDSTQCLLDSKSMFHVPVENRSSIANNRFNISGYPCLYLGNSILACWEEMVKPNLEQFYVSQVELRNKKNKKVIDLRWDTYVDIPRITEDDGFQGEKYVFTVYRFHVGCNLSQRRRTVVGGGEGEGEKIHHHEKHHGYYRQKRNYAQGLLFLFSAKEGNGYENQKKNQIANAKYDAPFK